MKTLFLVLISVLTNPYYAQYEPVESFKVLTLNLLFTETGDRTDRYQQIVDYIVENDINIILLQECVNEFSDTQNSAEYIQDLLNEHHNYFLFSVMENESFGNAILSSYPIIHTDFCDIDTSLIEKTLSWKRRVLMAQLQLPDAKLNVYATHLCAGCSATDRRNQTKRLLGFVRTTDRKHSASASIIGGDFNINIDKESSSYNLVTRSFYDTFLKANNLEFGSWCSEDCDIGCTYGLENNPYAYGPKRIDYIFSSRNLDPMSSERIFDSEQQWVSDHCGLLTGF